MKYLFPDKKRMVPSTLTFLNIYTDQCAGIHNIDNICDAEVTATCSSFYHRSDMLTVL